MIACFINFRNTHLFLIGGGSNYRDKKRVDFYSINEDKWSTAPSLNSKRDNHASCALGSIIYVFGGCTDNYGTCNSFEIFDAYAYITGEFEE